MENVRSAGEDNPGKKLACLVIKDRLADSRYLTLSHGKPFLVVFHIFENPGQSRKVFVVSGLVTTVA